MAGRRNEVEYRHCFVLSHTALLSNVHLDTKSYKVENLFFFF